ncbi:MAG TPA: PepSY-associated TM helix domain-containing protein [Pyrinomonadaceae bacterium]|nr:PepSY-associated TM helix domain-containing protein [Pyrinomonadaceae bacterium]
MRKFIYQAHLMLGVFVSIPVLAWALSGLLYALPNTVEGGAVEKIDAARVRVSPPEAMAKAGELAGKQLPTTALTLLMRDGRPQYQAIGGLGADSIFIDAETGESKMSPPPPWQTRFFREAHFYFFAGSWQVTLLVIFSVLAALSALSGIYLNIKYWMNKISPRRRPYLSS